MTFFMLGLHEFICFRLILKKNPKLFSLALFRYSTYDENIFYTICSITPIAQ